MSGTFQPRRLKRYKALLMLMLRHHNRLRLQPVTLEQASLHRRDKILPGQHEAAAHLARELESLGPTFIKLGQALSVRPDLLPQPYLDALARLQDDVEAVPFEHVRATVESELSDSLDNLFAEFDPEPLASASLGQVHAARLHDGREVVAKVQHPHIAERVIEDLELLETTVKLLEEHTEIGQRLGLLQMLEEFQQALLHELDYEQEARNLHIAHRLTESHESLAVPRTVDALCTCKVLVIERVHGKKVAEITPDDRDGIDGKSLARSLYTAYLEQILLHGQVHADPHPGNVFLTESGQVALLDFGMTAHVDPERRRQILKLLLAVTEGRGQQAGELGINLCTALNGNDRQRALRQTASLVGQTQQPVGVYRQTGRVVLELVRIAADNHFRPAPELILLGKTLLCLDNIVEHLAPDFNPRPVLERQVLRILASDARRRLQGTRLLAAGMETQDLIAELPRHLNRMFTHLSENSLRLRIDALDQNRLMHNIEKIGNRIAAGLVLAALILGAALLMRVDSGWTIFGYPGLALVLFIGAVLLGLFLVISILFNKD